MQTLYQIYRITRHGATMGIVLLPKLGVAMILMIFAELLFRSNGTTEVIFDLSPYPIPDLH